jgi:uncharacterized membrane protein
MTTKTKSPERLVFFSDAVVAIALTLLILPLADAVRQVYSGPGVHGSSIEVITKNQWLIYSFLLSFVVITRQWLLHHRLFEQVKEYNRPLLLMNLGWVLTIAILPFPTEMVGLFPSYDRFTLLFYIGTLLVSSILLSAMTLVIRADQNVARSPDAISDEWLRSSLASMAMLAIAMLLVGIFPRVSYFSLLLLVLPGLYERIRRRRDKRPSSPTQLDTTPV